MNNTKKFDPSAYFEGEPVFFGKVLKTQIPHDLNAEL